MHETYGLGNRHQFLVNLFQHGQLVLTIDKNKNQLLLIISKSQMITVYDLNMQNRQVADKESVYTNIAILALAHAHDSVVLSEVELVERANHDSRVCFKLVYLFAFFA